MARRGPRLVRGPKRSTQWLFMDPSRNTMAAASTAVFRSSLNAAALALRPFTVVRSIITLTLGSDQQAASEDYDAAFGMCVVSDQARAIGVTAIPTPMTDLGSDLWFFHQILSGSFNFVTGIGIDAQGIVPTAHQTFESKAMRKVEEGQDLAVVVETSAISLGAIMYSAGRILIKLH